jgi:hypothetical protein
LGEFGAFCADSIASPQDMNHVTVRPVIELGVETVTPPSNTSGGQLASVIQAQAAVANYSKTPDGWFVPLAALMDRIESVADYLHFEAAYYNEFEVFGGFEIIAEDGRAVGVALGSMLRNAMDMATAIINLRNGNRTCRAFIENDRYLDFVLNEDAIRITTGHIAQHISQVELLVSAEELRQGMSAAQYQLQNFASQIEPLLTRFSDTPVSPQLIRLMFGLVK